MIRLTLAATLLACAAPGLAQAVDLLPPPPPPAQPVEIGTGWYLRGDFTQSWFAKPKDALRFDPNDPGAPPMIGLRMSPEGGYGGGIGYRIFPPRKPEKAGEEVGTYRVDEALLADIRAALADPKFASTASNSQHLT